ncbi:unnamed protein product [Clavelina lepadiformis]|uniref:Uncharacterized protein n=1 Tax=Clavelina lepadiformis TaxID=159417 RepID=A0ABP0F7J3_CLALP
MHFLHRFLPPLPLLPNNSTMSMFPESTPDFQIDNTTPDPPAVPSPSATMPDAPIPDSADSPDEQSAPAPQLSIIRPGEQGSSYLLPRRADLAVWKW